MAHPCGQKLSGHHYYHQSSSYRKVEEQTRRGKARKNDTNAQAANWARDTKFHLSVANVAPLAITREAARIRVRVAQAM